MSQVTEQSVRVQNALASSKLIEACAVLDLKENDFDFLTSNKVWIATDRSRARRCVEACVYGTLDFVGYPCFPAPVEFIAAVIAYYVHPVNIQTACLIMEGAEFTENIINGVERLFFQAEVCIRDLTVTGVQTCALPILGPVSRLFHERNRKHPRRGPSADRSGKNLQSRMGHHSAGPRVPLDCQSWRDTRLHRRSDRPRRNIRQIID